MRAEHMEEMQEKINDTIQQLNTQHSGQMFELRERHQEEKDVLEKAAAAKVKKLQSKFADAEAKHKEEVDRLKADFDLELKKAKDVRMDQ